MTTTDLRHDLDAINHAYLPPYREGREDCADDIRRLAAARDSVLAFLSAPLARFSLELCRSNSGVGGRYSEPTVIEEWTEPLTAAEIQEIKDRAPLLNGFFYRVRQLED